MSHVADEDLLRADLYDFLGALLSHAPDRALLERAAALGGGAGALGDAVAALARVAQCMTPAEAEREYTALFIGLGRGELLPYASFYLTGFLNEKPLAELRGDMARLAVARTPNVFEPEDNIASLMEIMAGLIRGRFAAEGQALEVQRHFFDTHIARWAPHFFADLEGAQSSVLYALVGTIGRVFMEIEAEGFRLMGAPAA
ncbi:TorD/DmsD family molecular chaperone [Pontivivens ytuae]|uniref:Molecular chaperone TorD family protein n=1 Tax=Pontivivens ytuae TaxID=2789856 RepID=A0A7S9LQD8_9RHOB|nr:molecular chaperone TorD family protein [Pontivivens ytuae]QPH53201.1 molecular chaperone TorD family protein [Pontivivens ytuae]